MIKYIFLGTFLLGALLCHLDSAIGNKPYKYEGVHAIKSTVLNQEMNYTVLLPANYAADTLHYPVIYLLHGYGGDENSWLNRCDVEHIMDSLTRIDAVPASIIIMPEARNSYYIDDYLHRFKMGTYFIQEFIPSIENQYRVAHGSQNRLIAGLSMGGYGAVILSMKNPGMFGTCISLSGAVRTDSILVGLTQKTFERYYSPLLGDSLKGIDRITSHWLQHSPYHLMNDSLATFYQQQRWYFDCGMYDFLLPANEALHQLFLNYTIPHEYHMRIGKHQWEYWRGGFINGLLFWGAGMKK